MKKILLPTDFSDNARNAIHYALNLFKDVTATFYLLHTYTPVIYSYDYRMSSGGYLGEITDIVKENANEKLREIEKEVTDKFHNQNHHFEIVSSFNLLTDEIKDMVERNSIDLIVMGTKGATGAKEILFGTNTIHIIQKTKCPVLAIPDGHFFETPTEILFPTDYKVDYSEKQFENLKTIVHHYNSKVHILHVSRGGLSDIQNANRTTLEKLLASLITMYHNVEDQPIPEAINNFQKSTYVQMLMMINNKHSFFENLFFKPVINQIGFHLNIPFLVIPAKM